MAVTTNPGVTIVPQADGAGAGLTIVATGTQKNVKIKKIVLVAAAANSSATVTDGGDRVIAMLAAPISSSDEIDFNADAFQANGLKVSAMLGASANVFIYGG